MLLSLPVDVQAEPAADAVLPEIRRWPRLSPAPETVTALADALARARRPLFLAGRGARQAKAELRQLAERAGALPVTSASCLADLAPVRNNGNLAWFGACRIEPS